MKGEFLEFLLVWYFVSRENYLLLLIGALGVISENFQQGRLTSLECDIKRYERY